MDWLVDTILGLALASFAGLMGVMLTPWGRQFSELDEHSARISVILGGIAAAAAFRLLTHALSGAC